MPRAPLLFTAWQRFAGGCRVSMAAVVHLVFEHAEIRGARTECHLVRDREDGRLERFELDGWAIPIPASRDRTRGAGGEANARRYEPRLRSGLADVPEC